METIIEIVLESLDKDKVNVKKIKKIEVDGKHIVIGVERQSYRNSLWEREELTKNLPAEYSSAVLEIWGATPTVVPEEPTQHITP